MAYQAAGMQWAAASGPELSPRMTPTARIRDQGGPFSAGSGLSWRWPDFVALHCFIALHCISLQGCLRPPPRNAMQRKRNPPGGSTSAGSPMRHFAVVGFGVLVWPGVGSAAQPAPDRYALG